MPRFARESASSQLYEAQVVGAFIYELGFQSAKDERRITVNLLAHSPGDAAVGDLFVEGTRCFLLEFKGTEEKLRTECEKPRRKPFFKRLKNDEELTGLSARTHFALYPSKAEDASTVHLAAFAYHDICPRPTGLGSRSRELASLVTESVLGRGDDRLGLDQQDFAWYVQTLVTAEEEVPPLDPGTGSAVPGPLDRPALAGEVTKDSNDEELGPSLLLVSADRVNLCVGSSVVHSLVASATFRAALNRRRLQKNLRKLNETASFDAKTDRGPGGPDGPSPGDGGFTPPRSPKPRKM